MENKFVMFHDALAQWNEKEAQEYIELKYPGFTGRFIKPVGTTCAVTIYKDMPPGNSPKNARGLDSYGFADLEYSMCFNCALSWVYPYGDPRRIFGQGTPKEVWHLMTETWKVVGAPSNCMPLPVLQSHNPGRRPRTPVKTGAHIFRFRWCNYDEKRLRGFGFSHCPNVPRGPRGNPTRAPHFTPQHWLLCHMGLY